MTLAHASSAQPRATEPWADRGLADVVHGFDGLRFLSGELAELASRCGTPATARPPWVLATLALEPDGQPFGVLVRDSTGLLEGAALLVSTTTSTYGSVQEFVQLAGSSPGHRGALLASSPGAAHRLGVALSTVLASGPPGYHLHLGPLDSSCQVAGALAEALPGVVRTPTDPVPVVRRAPGESSSDYLSANMQRTLRKATNRLRRDGRELTVRFTKDRVRIARLLPELEATHRDRDHARGRNSDLGDGNARLIWHARMRALADEGSLELAVARIDGQLAAYVLGITDRPTYRVLEGHMVTEWSRYAPGRVLEWAVLRRVLDDRSYDTLDWMTSVASDTLLAANDRDRMVTLRKD
ncbi:MAG TPA: GNAT family N-acetyltransferase [Actinomycetes bacterium]